MAARTTRDQTGDSAERGRTATTTDTTTDTTTGTTGSAARNEVLLVGRVAAPPEERELPSGDRLVTLRLVVDRPAPVRPAPGRTVSVDTLDCACWTAGARRTARSLQAGDVVEVHGALRRRFWRGGAGAASRTEVEVAALRRLSRAAATAGARSGRRAPAPADPPQEA